MARFESLSVFLCVMGLLSETLSSLTLEAEAGDNVTIWCQHDLKGPEKIFWFKHTNESVPLLLGCKKFRTSAPSEPCSFFSERFYYCNSGDKMILSNSTFLQVKDCRCPAVFFILIVVFGAVIVFLLGVLIFIILKHRKTHRGAEANNGVKENNEVNHPLE
ncbi:hypothetical protein QTP86_012564 [Hemibagrus guttatus]|nr:hypothetical protein QTP86_012564 [Hemibagrus guttatus]